MNITVETVPARVPVTVVRLAGALDGSNYRDLIARGQALFAEGARALLLDLTELTYISSAGLASLHQLALRFGGAEAPDPEEAGWRALREMSETTAPPSHVQLLNPQPRVNDVLVRSGLKPFFE